MRMFMRLRTPFLSNIVDESRPPRSIDLSISLDSLSPNISYLDRFSVLRAFFLPLTICIPPYATLFPVFSPELFGILVLLLLHSTNWIPRY